MRTAAVRSAAGATLGLTALLLLSGCTLVTTLADGGSDPVVTSTTTSTTEATESATPTETETPTPTPTPTPTAVAGTMTGIEDLIVGDCFDLESGADDAELFPSCDTLHTYEAYHSEDMTGGDTFPGDSAVDTALEDICSAAFTGFIGAEPFLTSWNYTGIVPSAESWAGGDREVLCIVTPVDGQPTAGTAEGSAS
ncbi:septum formation family protein [Pseudoclavibacter helvolus]|uniref:septum formation family protein n=1 Tax=Pseudoclavibacter helvolus TaxID=255205 RepID=UPI0024ADEDEF|nr:septum formation family protein [Pseudoclavibacter helvolus]